MAQRTLSRTDDEGTEQKIEVITVGLLLHFVSGNMHKVEEESTLDTHFLYVSIK